MPRLLSAPLALVCLSVMELSLMGAGCTDANAKRDDANSDGSNSDDANSEIHDDKPWHVEEGEISFYADSLAGNLTANGEKFDPKQATCAHRTLPFGTELKISIGKGDKAVSATCRVNDRGPYAKDRVLDVSSSLAKTLGFKTQGHADATLTSVGPRPATKTGNKTEEKPANADDEPTPKRGD